jgi:hypothetical protein
LAVVQARGGEGAEGLLLLHQQGLGQLSLVLLDLLLHVIDCTCNLQEEEVTSERDTKLVVSLSVSQQRTQEKIKWDSCSSEWQV